MAEPVELTFPLLFSGVLVQGGAERPVLARPLPPEADDAAALFDSTPAQLVTFCDQDELLARLPSGALLRVALRCGFVDAAGVTRSAALLLELSALEPGRTFRAGLRVSAHEAWGAPHVDLEQALLSLRPATRGLGTLRLCFFCALSDYEPSAGYGHLFCFRAVPEAYRAAAQAPVRERKRAVWDLWSGAEPVAETHACERFEPRPDSWGYRG